MTRNSLRSRKARWTGAAFVCLLAAAVSIVSGGTTAHGQTALVASPAHPQSLAPAMRLDAGDLVEITTFDTPELSGKFRVDSRGEVIMPIGGAVPVAGLTAEQAGIAVQRFLRDRDILKNPHVTVLVLEYATQSVSVLGEVKTPGVYPLEGKHGALDFISMAGGLTPSASKQVNITHRTPPWDTVTVNLAGGNGGALANDVEIQPGDRIVVLRAGVVYVIGDVGKPGGYVMDGANKVTVVQALALAQGLNRTAKSNGMLIRSSPGGRTQTQLALNKILANQSPDPKLEDGDIVYVPMSGAKDWTNKGVSAALQMAVGMVVYGHY